MATKAKKRPPTIMENCSIDRRGEGKNSWNLHFEAVQNFLCSSYSLGVNYIFLRFSLPIQSGEGKGVGHDDEYKERVVKVLFSTHLEKLDKVVLQVKPFLYE